MAYRHLEGKVGDIEFAGNLNVMRPAHVVIPKVIVSAVAIAALYFCTFTMTPIPLDLRSVTLLTVGLLLYLVLAWFVRPKPDTDNLVGFGGMYEDLYDSSVEANRRLRTMQVGLMPGLFVSSAFIELATLLGLIPEVTEEGLKQLRTKEIEELAARSRPPEPEHTVELSSARFMKSSPE